MPLLSIASKPEATHPLVRPPNNSRAATTVTADKGAALTPHDCMLQTADPYFLYNDLMPRLNFQYSEGTSMYLSITGNSDYIRNDTSSMSIHTVMKRRLKRANSYTLYNAGNILFFQSTCLLGLFPIYHDCTSGRAHMCTQSFLENRNGLSSLPQTVFYPLLSLLRFPQKLFLKWGGTGNTGIFLGLFASTFFGLLPDFSVVFSDLKTGTRIFSQSKAKTKGPYPSYLQIHNKKSYVSDFEVFQCVMSHCKATLEDTSPK